MPHQLQRRVVIAHRRAGQTRQRVAQRAVWALASNLADVTTQAPSSSSAYWTEAMCTRSHLVAVTTTTNRRGYGDYVLLNAAATTLTCRPARCRATKVWVTAANSLTTNILARSGNPIGGTADDVYLDDANRTWCATAINSHTVGGFAQS